MGSVFFVGVWYEARGERCETEIGEVCGAAFLVAGGRAGGRLQVVVRLEYVSVWRRAILTIMDLPQVEECCQRDESAMARVASLFIPAVPQSALGWIHYHMLKKLKPSEMAMLAGCMYNNAMITTRRDSGEQSVHRQVRKSRESTL